MQTDGGCANIKIRLSNRKPLIVVDTKPLIVVDTKPLIVVDTKHFIVVDTKPSIVVDTFIKPVQPIFQFWDDCRVKILKPKCDSLKQMIL